MKNWLALKLRPTQFADNKNTPGVDYAPKCTQSDTPASDAGTGTGEFKTMMAGLDDVEKHLEKNPNEPTPTA
jgi:hypothetical protein